MTRKHFKAIAKTFRDCKPFHTDVQKFEQWKECVIEMGRTLKYFNVLFNEELFLEECKFYD